MAKRRASPDPARPRAPARPDAARPHAGSPTPSTPSPWSGFHRLGAAERLRRVAEAAALGPEDLAALQAASGLPFGLAESFIENAVGSFPLPLGLAAGFVVDGRDVVVPMAVEESSVVAAASHGAKLAAAGGGFTTQVADAVTTGQVELRGLAGAQRRKAASLVARRAAGWRRQLDGLIPRMVARGGGVRRIHARSVGRDRLVVHVEVDCRDAMGANTVNTLCEALRPWAVEAMAQAGLRCRPGLAILSNLAAERLATATCRVPAAAVGGPAVVRAIVEADAFARLDPFRAATHNKGILNGIDPVAIATGNDWRAIEAGAHAWAARDGAYVALTRWRRARDGALEGSLTLPVAVGTVGGVTSLHPVARACLRVLGSPDARRLAGIMASVGLAQNLAALRALSTEGIQRGHMALHQGNLRLAAQGKAQR